MLINVTSTKVSNNITINTVLGYPSELVILKGYIYAKPWDNGENFSFLTLFSMVPIQEYKSQVDMFESAESIWPRTAGVFVDTIGPISGLIITRARVGLRTYQNHLEQNGWNFLDTVPGVKGESYETARKMSFAHIQRLKKKGIKISTVSATKVEANTNNKTNENIKVQIQEFLDSALNDIMILACKDEEAPSCETCDFSLDCVYRKVEETFLSVKSMLNF